MKAGWPKSEYRRFGDGLTRPSVTVAEAARHLGVSEGRVRRSQRLRKLRIGHRVFIPAGDVYAASCMYRGEEGPHL